jgi:hypothetical protein
MGDEVQKELHKLQLEVNTIQSKIDGKLSNVAKELSSLNENFKEFTEHYYGDGMQNPGIPIRLDRLEQAKKRQSTIGYILLPVVASLVLKVIWDIFSKSL